MVMLKQGILGGGKSFTFLKLCLASSPFQKKERFFLWVYSFFCAQLPVVAENCAFCCTFCTLSFARRCWQVGGGHGTRREREGGPPPPTDKCPLWLNCHTVLARCFALQQRRKRRLHYVIAFFPRRIDFFSSPLFRVCVYICGNNALAFKVVVMKSIFIWWPSAFVRTKRTSWVCWVFYFVFFFREDGCSGLKKFLLAEMQFFPFFGLLLQRPARHYFPHENLDTRIFDLFPLKCGETAAVNSGLSIPRILWLYCDRSRYSESAVQKTPVLNRTWAFAFFFWTKMTVASKFEFWPFIFFLLSLFLDFDAFPPFLSFLPPPFLYIRKVHAGKERPHRRNLHAKL